MEIQVEKIVVNRLPKLPNGYFYTQSGEVEIQNRVISNDYIWLACNSTPDDWKIITQEEADAILEEQARHNAQLNEENGIA
jgi:hypothetical protein